MGAPIAAGFRKAHGVLHESTSMTFEDQNSVSPIPVRRGAIRYFAEKRIRLD